MQAPINPAAMGPNGVPTNPINFLIAAADMHQNGQLPSQAPTPQRSIPRGQSVGLPTIARRVRKTLKVIK